MKMHLITLILAILAVIHTHAADLPSQLEGYWKPDMEKTLALAKKGNREMEPMTQAMMGKMVFEFQKDSMTVHGPPGFTSNDPAIPFKIKGVDNAANSLTLSTEGKEMMVRFNKGQMALNDPENGWVIFNRMSHEDFAKRDAGAAEIEVGGSGKAPATGKLEDVSSKSIPDTPAAGMAYGKEFKVEKAILENGNLKLRQGEGFFADFEFLIFLFNQDGKPDGKKITVKPNQNSPTAPIAHIHMSRLTERNGLPQNEVFTEKFALRLEFGTVKDGKTPGKIHLRLPDEAGSFVVGTFEAESE